MQYFSSSKRKDNGIIIIRGVECDYSGIKYNFKFSARDIVSKYEIQLMISLVAENILPLKSTDLEKNVTKEIIQILLIRKPIQIPAAKIENEKLKFEVFELNRQKGRVLLCEAEWPQNSLKPGLDLSLTTKNGLIQGYLMIEQCERVDKNTFLTYIFNNIEINTIIGIDFTSTNGNQFEDTSLHYINDQKNVYASALQEIVGIFQYFSSSRSIPVYGFGAKLPPYYDIISHCFSVKNDFFNPQIQSSEKIIADYFDLLPKIKFHGPAVFYDLIEHALHWTQTNFGEDDEDDNNEKDENEDEIYNKNKKQKKNKQEQNFQVLVILTNAEPSIWEKQSAALGLLDDSFSDALGIVIVNVANPYILPDKDKNSNEIQKYLAEQLGVQFAYYQKECFNRKQFISEILKLIPEQFSKFASNPKNNIQLQKKIQNMMLVQHEFMNQKIKQIKQNRYEKIQSPAFLKKYEQKFLEQMIKIGYDETLANNLISQGILCDVIIKSVHCLIGYWFSWLGDK